MRYNHISDATKFLILIATIIVVCVLCAAGFKLVNSGKSGVSSTTNQFNDMTSSFSDINTSLYDGSLVMGSELTSLVKKAIDNNQFISIEVATLGGSTTDYNYTFNREELTITQEGAQTEVPDERGQYAYIHPMSKFLGETIKDDNGNIICIRFEQQK
ncbi:MAG TPA: hypothetical protein VN131_00605 [Mobilitalea sp.]|nr:hypothetical protein [Mobilitalea sp.]